MFIKGSFSKNINILKMSMDTALLRRNVIANNLANSETPNFKRSVINFEAQLKRALDSEKVRQPYQHVTDQRHIPFYRPMDYRSVTPRRVLDYLTTAKNNGNNVDMEEEMMQALQNQLRYQTMVSIVNSEFGRVNLVLR